MLSANLSKNLQSEWFIFLWYSHWVGIAYYADTPMPLCWNSWLKYPTPVESPCAGIFGIPQSDIW